MNEHQLVSLRSLKLVNGDGIFVLAKCRVAEDVNSAKVDLLIYSQNSVLESKGLQQQAIVSRVKDKMEHAMASLTELLTKDIHYTYQLRPQMDGYHLFVQWTVKSEEELVYTLHFPLHQIDDDVDKQGAVLEAIQCLLDNIESTKISIAQLKTHNNSLSDTCLRASELQEEYVSHFPEQKDALLNGMTEVLNRKKNILSDALGQPTGMDVEMNLTPVGRGTKEEEEERNDDDDESSLLLTQGSPDKESL